MLGSIKEPIVTVDKIITFFIITNYKTFNYGIKFYLIQVNKKLVFIYQNTSLYKLFKWLKFY